MKSLCILPAAVLLFLARCSSPDMPGGEPQLRSLDAWTYIHVDSTRASWGDFDDPDWLRYFGLAMADVTGDGYRDIASGRYFYRNPGGDMRGVWARVDLGSNVDAMIMIDVDDDPYGDIIAEALPALYWYEAEDAAGSSWTPRVIGELPATGHINSQGYATAQIIPGGKPEVLLSSGDGIYCVTIPEHPHNGEWPMVRIAAEATEEGIGVGDLDGDGDLDIAAGKGDVGDNNSVDWWENPGDGSGDWTIRHVGETVYFADRFEIADINDDGRPDIVVSEERWPEPENAGVHWYENPGMTEGGSWTRHTVVTQNTGNNLDIADMDGDGDIDIITAEHRGTKRLTIFENDGNGLSWTPHLVSAGRENHLGARLADMDNDGDPDMLGIAWDDYPQLHLWRNDAVSPVAQERTGFSTGDVFREYTWSGPWVNADRWQRVTHPEATQEGANEFLPNPVNQITISDLVLAGRAEAVIELLQCHAGTTDKRIRVNGNDWIAIPEAPLPVDNQECYQTMTYPVVRIPLAHLREGENTLELTCGGQSCHDFGWGQSLVYGITFRIYYAEQKRHPEGNITSPEPGASIGEYPSISVDARYDGGIGKIDIIGRYEDFIYRGDDRWLDWQYAMRYGELIHHIGTATQAPWETEWDTGWLPDQDQPVSLMARITGIDGMTYVTPVVGDLEFERDGSVRLYKPSDIPEKWQTRAGLTHSCTVMIDDDLSTAVEARMMLVNWCGQLVESIGINGMELAGPIGRDHDISYDELDIPVSVLRRGRNEPYTYSSTEHHGIEVNWPGIAIKVRYRQRRNGISELSIK